MSTPRANTSGMSTSGRPSSVFYGLNDTERAFVVLLADIPAALTA
jgi:hypothetical protein